MIETKLQEVSGQAFSPETVAGVPVYRCLVLLGHEFQNFPSEVSKVFKMRSNLDRNIVKWMLQGRKTTFAAAQKGKGLVAQHQIYSLQGGQQVFNLHREESLQVYNN